MPLRRVSIKPSIHDSACQQSGILDTQIHTARPERRMDVCGIAGQKYPSNLIRFRLPNADRKIGLPKNVMHPTALR
jgi:hypothetical protein